MGDSMKYIENVRYMEGVIIDFDECSVSIDFKGRMGFLKIPKRLLITDYDLKIGQEIGLNMSYLEVISGEVNEKYISNIMRNNREVESNGNSY